MPVNFQFEFLLLFESTRKVRLFPNLYEVASETRSDFLRTHCDQINRPSLMVSNHPSNPFCFNPHTFYITHSHTFWPTGPLKTSNLDLTDPVIKQIMQIAIWCIWSGLEQAVKRFKRQCTRKLKRLWIKDFQTVWMLLFSWSGTDHFGGPSVSKVLDWTPKPANCSLVNLKWERSWSIDLNTFQF